MKYKKLTKEQIVISLDRLTRFKNTKEKYLRVYGDIISSSLIEPKIRKTDIEFMDFEEITAIVTDIFNNSISSDESDLRVNNILKKYENSVFNNDESVQKLLNNRINYCAASEYIQNNPKVNLKWLKYIIDNKNVNLDEIRETYALKFPVKEVILVEGITEEILLPAFCRFLGYDFYKKGIHIIASGGKNQVVKEYYKLSEDVKLPIFILLDSDAKENIAQIEPKLRACDRIHKVTCGEFEDLLSKSLIVKTINSHFENFLSITEDDISQERPMVSILEELFKTKGLHEFKKAEFAKLVRENINSENDITDEIKTITEEIFKFS